MNRCMMTYTKIFIIILVGTFIFGCVSENKFDINKFVMEKYPNCDEPKFCNELVKVNCNSEADGPLYYLNKTNGNQISICGGACWHPQNEQVEVCKTLCPPKEWTCD